MLHHTGWGDGGERDLAYGYFDHAWGSVPGNLKERFKQGPIDWTAWLQQLRPDALSCRPQRQPAAELTLRNHRTAVWAAAFGGQAARRQSALPTLIFGAVRTLQTIVIASTATTTPSETSTGIL